MKYLLPVILICLFGFSSCEQEDFSIKATEANYPYLSEKVNDSHYLAIAELADLININLRGKSDEEISEDEIAAFAAEENIDVMLIGQQMVAKIEELKAEGLSDDDVAERMAEEQLSAMGITRNKAGTPCYDSYIDNLRTTYIGYGICLTLSGGTGLFACTLGALAGQTTALIKYETCLDNKYPDGA